MFKNLTILGYNLFATNKLLRIPNTETIFLFFVMSLFMLCLFVFVGQLLFVNVGGKEGVLHFDFNLKDLTLLDKQTRQNLLNFLPK